MAHAPLEIGSVLDSRYRIDALVGQGGMASVYRATDLTLRRAVAVKVAHASATGASTLTLFLNEAQALARVEHPGLVPVYAVGRSGELYYLAMKFIEGRSLSQVLKAQPKLPPAQVARILIDVCAALEALHQSGLVHRDVKPGNIMIGDDGKVTVMDLGIVQSANTSEVASTLGTPRYMAPEMLSDGEIDGRADVYALGVIGYHALTGGVPFDGPTPMAVLYMHAHQAVDPVRSRAPEVPKALAAAIETALAKEPDARYPSAQAFAQAIREAIRPARRGLWVLLAALVVAGVLTAVLWPKPQPVVPPPDDRDPVHARVDGITGTQTGQPGTTGSTGGAQNGGTQPSDNGSVSGQPSGAPRSTDSAAPQTAASAGVATAAPNSVESANPASGQSTDSVGGSGGPPGVAPASDAAIIIAKVLSSPLGATVKQGRKTLGKTPLSLERPKGSPSITVQIIKPGYDPVKRRVHFKKDSTVRARLKSGFDLVP